MRLIKSAKAMLQISVRHVLLTIGYYVLYGISYFMTYGMKWIVFTQCCLTASIDICFWLFLLKTLNAFWGSVYISKIKRGSLE